MDTLSARELMQTYFSLLTRLEQLDLIRTRNSPLGDVAELIVRQAYGGVLEPNSVKSSDLRAADGRRIQVKARATASGGQFSSFRSFDFDDAVFLVFDPADGRLREAWEASAPDVRRLCRYTAHTNSNLITVSKVRSIGTDVTSLMSAAFDEL